MQLTQIIADKEKKSSSYKDSKLDSLSDEKVAKIKKFAKEYIAKVLHKMEKSSKKRNSSSSTMHASSTSAETPNSHGDGDGGDVVMADITVEQAMDLEEDSASDEDRNDEHQEADQSPDPCSPAHEDIHHNVESEGMGVWAGTSDPQPRHTEESVNGWGRDRGPHGSVVSVGS